jgi:hypothetical protein
MQRAAPDTRPPVTILARLFRILSRLRGDAACTRSASATGVSSRSRATPSAGRASRCSSVRLRRHTYGASQQGWAPLVARLA